MTGSHPKGPWPALPFAAWRGTRDTLHMWTQILGKTLLARAPFENHWWHAALRVTPRGLGSLAVPGADRSFDLELDLVDHQLSVRTSDGRTAGLPLAAGTVRSFYEEYLALLSTLGIDAHVWGTPVEVTDPIPFDEDDVHGEYVPSQANRFWEVLRLCDAAFRDLASSFLGKQSPVHFFWGSFDLAATRFSGRRAPDRPGADRITREAYSHEVISFGFWPGGTTPGGVSVDEPVLYAYAAPEPGGLRETDIGVRAAGYDERLGEFLLPYEAVRTAHDPARAVLTFCERVYEAGATLGGWDRPSLERGPERRDAPGAAAHDAVHPIGL